MASFRRGPVGIVLEKLSPFGVAHQRPEGRVGG